MAFHHITLHYFAHSTRYLQPAAFDQLITAVTRPYITCDTGTARQGHTRDPDKLIHTLFLALAKDCLGCVSTLDQQQTKQTAS